jgi:hypothetical protein
MIDEKGVDSPSNEVWKKSVLEIDDHIDKCFLIGGELQIAEVI